MQLTKKESMTSLELLKEINIFREKEGKETEMQHKTLLGIIRDEFEEEISQQELLLSNYYSRGKEFPMFILTLAQAKQVLSRESKFVRKAVIKYIENLEQQLQKPLSVEEMIISQAKSMIDVKKDIVEIKNQVSTVINTVTVNSLKQSLLQKAINRRVYFLFHSENVEEYKDLYEKVRKTREITSKMFRNIHRDIKTKFGVPSYRDVKNIEYEKALSFIDDWFPDKEVV